MVGMAYFGLNMNEAFGFFASSSSYEHTSHSFAFVSQGMRSTVGTPSLGFHPQHWSSFPIAVSTAQKWYFYARPRVSPPAPGRGQLLLRTSTTWHS